MSYLPWSITQKLRQGKCWNAWRHYQSSYSINKRCWSQHIFSVFAASPGRANSLLQNYFLQTRVPWGEMRARSSRWAHVSAPTRCSQHGQQCWPVWLDTGNDSRLCFYWNNSRNRLSSLSLQLIPSVLPLTLRSRKLLLLAEKAHCLLKKSAVVHIQEVSMDISGNTEIINSLLNVNERLDELDNHYFGFKFCTQAAWLFGVKRCGNVFPSPCSKLQTQIASTVASEHTHTHTRDICHETGYQCNLLTWSPDSQSTVKQEKLPLPEHLEGETFRAAAPPHLRSWE